MSARMAAYWLENARPLGAFFKDMKLREIRPALVAAYQNARTDAGRAPKTINGELSVLRQILKHAKLWYRFDDVHHAAKPEGASRPGADAGGTATPVRDGADPARLDRCTPTLRPHSPSIAVCVRARSRDSAGRTSI